ncbi:hypothetical protein GCM10009730_55480 [Streptomyces albidochromogenes]|uniref:hypothetical protein n=1 Tax=Streptomyces albidochromogenes TaxID=329524 RepID=UPI00110FC27E|nr:hypothetical protein [Streptomyces albidochromogenes]
MAAAERHLRELLKAVALPWHWRISAERNAQVQVPSVNVTGTAYDPTMDVRPGSDNQQLERLTDQVRALREAVDRGRAAGRDTDRHLYELVTRQIAAQRKESVDGLREEALGLLLIFIGTVIGTLPGLFC